MTLSAFPGLMEASEAYRQACDELHAAQRDVMDRAMRAADEPERSYRFGVALGQEEQPIDFEAPVLTTLDIGQLVANHEYHVTWHQGQVMLHGDWSNVVTFSIDADYDSEPEKKSIELLTQWLSPAQLRQFKRQGHFDVKGCTTGKRYRVKRGTVQNVYELNWRGRVTHGWCFAPQGALATGDTMLAQKIALETDERAALKIANKFLV
jgi:hypothetical protein